MKCHLAGLVLALAAALFPAAARAQQRYAEPTAREIVVAYNTGLRFSLAPGVIVPRGSGRVGLSVAADLRYGIETGPVIVAPGVRLSGFFPSGFVALTALGTMRLTLPLGPVGPYVLGGAGPGYLSEPSRAGFAYQGGGGVMIHIGRSFALGVEATYLGITNSDFRALFVGPSLLLGF